MSALTLTDYLEAGEDPQCYACGDPGSLHGNDDGSCTRTEPSVFGYPDCDLDYCPCPEFELDPSEPPPATL